MRKIAITLGLAFSLAFSSCAAGPHQLARTVDDWNQEMYVDNPWLNGLLHAVPVMPAAEFIAKVGDFFVTDGYAFWVKDAWDQKGTAFTHKQVTPTDGAMGNLFDGGKWLEIR